MAKKDPGTSTATDQRILLLEEESRRQKKEFGQLLEISQSIISELEIEKVAELVVNRVAELIHAETVILPIINEDRKSYTYLAAGGIGAEALLGITLKINVGMCGWVLQHGRPLLFGKPEQWWMAEKATWEEGLQSALLVPLFGKNGIIGGLSALGRVGGGSFSEHDLDLLTVFANQVSVAIENARLFHERQSVIKELETEIDERKLAVEELAREKERLAVTLRSIGDGVVTTDIDGHIVLLNRVAEELTGWTQSEAQGRKLVDVFSLIKIESRESCEDPILKVLDSGEIFGFSDRRILVGRDGRERIIADSAAPIFDLESRIVGVVLVFRDITERLRMEEEILKIKKLETVGSLAGGIAHDFNNILSAILGNIDLAQVMYPEKGDELHVLLTEAKKATIRAGGLTRQLLTFAKGGEPVKEFASISEVIRESADFVLRGSKVKCEYCFAENLEKVKIDAGQISQVIQNAVINSMQAMPEGGTISVACGNYDHKNGVNTILPVGSYLRITIRDEGCGIPKKILPRVFDPFFTTKGMGSGLGLATSHSIVVKHGGRIILESDPGVGTTVTIYLPVTHVMEQEIDERIGHDPDDHVGRNLVMIMDDEEMVCTVAQKMLELFGYEVVTVVNGQEAIEVFRQRQGSGKKVDLIIMDLTIPGGMGGEEAVKEILRLDPKAKVLVASGYSTDPIMAKCQEYGFCGAVEKPFQLQGLVDVVKKALNRDI